jgi:hypothetical protein
MFYDFIIPLLRIIFNVFYLIDCKGPLLFHTSFGLSLDHHKVNYNNN